MIQESMEPVFGIKKKKLKNNCILVETGVLLEILGSFSLQPFELKNIFYLMEKTKKLKVNRYYE